MILFGCFPLQLFFFSPFDRLSNTSGTYFQVSNFIIFLLLVKWLLLFYFYTRSSLEVGPVTMYIFLGRRWKLKCLHLMRLVLWTKTLAVTYALFCSHLLLNAFIILNSLWVLLISIGTRSESEAENEKKNHEGQIEEKINHEFFWKSQEQQYILHL